MSHYSPLFAGLWDDAAVFPPGNAPLGEAVPAHRAHKTAWYSDYVGSFLIGASRISELAPLAGPAEPLRVTPVVPNPEAVGDAVRAVFDTPGLLLAGIEVAGDTAKAVAALHEHLPEDLSGAVEIPRGASLDALAGTRHRAKFRTGGTTADAFPTVGELADFLAAAAERDLPVKLTAGMHNAVRHTDPDTGFEHHGFLNVLLASYLVRIGASRDDVVANLAHRDGHRIADEVRALEDPQIDEIRGFFTAYGTCSIGEPLADLIELGLLARP
jgi:hypothetical protein